MLDDQRDSTVRVTDFKQWVYCPRVFYYQHCLPHVRPTTFSMQAGADAGRDEEGREERRSLRAYGLHSGAREFNVQLKSGALGVRGFADMVVFEPDGDASEAIPVDFKLSETAGEHFKLQLAAYALMLEEARGVTVRRGFLYFIPLRRAEEVPIDKRMRRKTMAALTAMRAVMERETMPPPTPQVGKCVSCEFRRFCNDVL